MRRLPLVFLLAASACFPKGAPPPLQLNPRQVELARAKDANVTDDQLEHGRVLFVQSCGECHDHPDLSAQKLSKWPDILTDMINRASLEKDPVAVSDLTKFVLTAAEAAQAP